MSANSTQSLLPIPSDIALITGPTMLGICLNWGFLGILVVQLYFYSQTYYKDRLHLKCLVYGLAILDFLQTFMVTADGFHWFVFGFGNMARLDDTYLNSWDVVLIDSLVALIVQSFYCWRIYLLQQSAILPSFIMMVSLAQCGGGIATAVIAHKLGHLSKISTEVPEQTTWLVCSAVADILITATLTWTLLRARARVSTSSYGMITKLVTLTVETNAITTATAILGLILFLGVPQHSTLVVPPTAILSKLYTNCLIAVLNNRKQTPTGTVKDLSSIETSGRHYFSTTGTTRAGTEVQIVRNVELKVDAEDIELGNVRFSKAGTLGK